MLQPELQHSSFAIGIVEDKWVMSVALEILRELPLAELRRLLVLRENQPRIEELMRQRDALLEQARRVQAQIDELVDSGSGAQRKKRIGPSVKALCEEVLRGRKRGLTAAEVKDAILERHPHRDNRTFYNQVFIALTRSGSFAKDRNGRFICVENGPSRSSKRDRNRRSR